MSENSIKFSHRYPKLLGDDGLVIKEAMLLQIIRVNLSGLSADFLNYDTNYGEYPLPEYGEYIMLIFMKPTEGNDAANLFTTLRRFTEDKFVYYHEKIGQMFKIVTIEGKEWEK